MKYENEIIKLYNEDCLIGLKNIKENTIDAIITDPPYGLKFMNNKWDYQIPSVECFSEMMRVLKPGGYMLVACATRTQHRMAVNIEDSGFEIRDIISWIYGSGFPKNKKLPDGMGTALKPAMELFTLARKPISEKTVLKNYTKWGVGLNIDECRIPGIKPLRENTENKEGMFGLGSRLANGFSEEGRFPSNLIHDGSSEVVDLFPKNIEGKEKFKHSASSIYKNASKNSFYNGESKSSYGSASRFFYCSKASKKERNGNDHPTVKPIHLMEYLIKLISKKRQLILDPFLGSGTTAIASYNTNRDMLGFEISEIYFKDAIIRYEFHTNQQQLLL